MMFHQSKSSLNRYLSMGTSRMSRMSYTSRTLRVLSLGVAVSLALSGCAYDRIVDSVAKSKRQAEIAGNQARDLRERKDVLESRSTMRQMNGLYVDTTPVKVDSSTVGGSTSQLDCNITFNPKTPVTIAEFSRVVNNLCGLSVQLTPDAMAYMNGVRPGMLPGAAGASPVGSPAGALHPGAGAPPVGVPRPGQNLATGALPPPTLNGQPMTGTSATAEVSNSVFTPAPNDTITGISWVNKPLRGLLDVVAARLGLGWKYEDNAVSMYYLDTQIFQLYSIPGRTAMKTQVKTGTSGGSSTGSGGGGGSSNSSADGSTQTTDMMFDSDIMKDMEAALQGMVTPTIGKLTLSPSTGVVTVMDRPDALRRIKAFIASENKRITRQVLLNVKVLSVALNSTDALGLNWTAVYQTIGTKVGLTNAFAGVGGGAAGQVSVVNSSSQFNGSGVVVDALSMQGTVTTVTSPSITTLNMKPAPVLVGKQTTYLAAVSTTAIQGGGTSQQSLTPGTVTTGFNMTVLPYLMEGSEMLLQYNINMSALIDIKTFASGGNSIQMPEVDNRIFAQSVRLRSGETLILSGFDSSLDSATQSGVGDPGMWLLGGRGDGATNRNVIVVLITPIIMD